MSNSTDTPLTYNEFGLPAMTERRVGHHAKELCEKLERENTVLREQLENLTAPKSMAQLTLETGIYNVPPNVMLVFNQLRAEVERLQLYAGCLEDQLDSYGLENAQKEYAAGLAARASEKGKTT